MTADRPGLFALTAAVLAALAAVLPAQTPDPDFYAADVFGRMRWQELGPVNFGGRVVDIEAHPDNPWVFYVASASGGIFKTTNNGTTFEPLFQDLYTCSIGDLAIAPSAPETLYVGTGEANNQRSSYWGDGVYKSTDGGKTWRHVGLQGTDHIGRIAVHPADPEVVFVAALGALYTPNEERGLYRSRDGGQSWQCVKHLGPDVGFVDVCIDPANPDTVYAASYERRRRAWNFVEGGPGSRIWKSTDGGDTWAMLQGGLPEGSLGRIGLAIFAGNSQVLYAAIENDNPLPPPKPEPATEDPTDNGAPAEAAARRTGGQARTQQGRQQSRQQGRDQSRRQRPRSPRRRTVGGEVYRSDDGGKSWRKTHETGSIGGSPGYYYGQIRVDPVDDQTVYVLSVPVYMSRDGGRTWTPQRRRRGGRGVQPTGRAFADSLHVDHHALWINPRDPGHAILGNDGGLAITYDRGQTWDHHDHLPIAQFYAITVDNRDPYRIYGGTQDNGSWGIPSRGKDSNGVGRQDAVRVGGGDGFYVQVDPDDPDVVYYESQFGSLGRRNLATGKNKRIRPRAPEGSPRLRFNWMSPVLLSPHNSKTVYFGSQYLHRSRDRGDHWEVISPDLTTADPDKLKGDVPHCTITTIAESPLREGVLWVGTDDGRLWVSKNGGGRWTELGDRLPERPMPLWVSRVEASRRDPDTAYVALTGYREDLREAFLYVTTDGGESFRRIDNDLPDEPINVVREHPRNHDVLLVGTEFGAYVSVNRGGNWFRLGDNLPRVAVHDLVVHPRKPHVIAGTHGRGIWVLDATALEELDEQVLGRAFFAFKPAGGVLLPRGFNQGYTGARTWRAANAFTLPTFRYYLRQETDDEVTVEVLDATGEVVWEGEASGEAGLHELTWSAGRRGRGFAGFRRMIGGRTRGPRAGQFAVRIALGEQEFVFPFEVRDERGSASVFGPEALDWDRASSRDQVR